MVDSEIESLVVRTALCSGGVVLVGAALGIGGAMPGVFVTCVDGYWSQVLGVVNGKHKGLLMETTL